ncbi:MULTISPECIES: hypothetical protein [unclassified Bradyrhizobium]|uniref:hypothetical protein n=1 Tax=unclassified Bradyrhizobium TaxID=2631580 RepID=UPI001FFB4CC6|nr:MULTISPECIES: hypothetical protein [unclassified Bradyrhizobium]MCK1502963.1 hypothetical protein [Bradyrhizobium sp. 188]UPJ29271.1 hypothetical protein IVB54_09710 [Bradyrhizobium sp. CW1]
MSKKVVTIDAARLAPHRDLTSTAEAWLRADDDITTKPQQRSKDGRQVKVVKELLPKAFPPDGYPPDKTTLQAIQNRLRPLVKKGSNVPSTDSIARALGRRNRRD